MTAGGDAFNDRVLAELSGNGRPYADCHAQNAGFQLSPALAQERWERLQACRQTNPSADDPLFRPIDADDFRMNGQNASNFTD